MLALCHAVVLTGYQIFTDKAVIIDNGMIIDLVDLDNIPTECEQVDLHGHYLCPGFIDVQLNGCGGVMFNQHPTSATLQHMQHTNEKSGTTSFLPTLISDSDDTIRQAITATREFMTEQQHQVLGMHLEGPYTNPERKGIHPIEQLRQPNDEMITWLAEQSPWLKKVTLAPEMNQLAHIEQLNKAGIVVSLGHTGANYEQTMAAIEHGVSFATHLYNAMTPTLNGREPGVVGAIYDSADIYAGIIADGHHVHWANVRLAHKVLGERLVLVTDATAGAMPPADMTEFDFCGATIYLKDGLCIDSNGTLGGSALTMDEGVRLLVSQAGLPFDEAVRMATLYPARAIGVDQQLGSIKAGYVANLIVLDQDYKVLATLVNGELTHGHLTA